MNSRNYVTVREKLNPYYVSSAPINVKHFPIFSVGSSVLSLNLRTGPKWLESTIVGILGRNVYEVYVHSLDTVWKRHKNQILLMPDNSKSKMVTIPKSSHIANFSPNVPILFPVGNNSSHSTPNLKVASNVSNEVANDSDGNGEVLRRSTRLRKKVERFQAS